MLSWLSEEDKEEAPPRKTAVAQTPVLRARYRVSEEDRTCVERRLVAPWARQVRANSVEAER